DAVAAQLDRTDPGQADHTVLGGAVGAGMRHAGFRGLGGDVDDAPATALGDHRLRSVLGAQERAAQVDPEHRVPFLDIHVHDGLHQVADAGVVDEDVDAAEALHDPCDHRLDLAFLQHVQRHGDALAPGRGYRGGG